MESCIQSICDELNTLIHKTEILNTVLSDHKSHCKAFTAIDLIEDTQNAIDEFCRVDEKTISKRHTLYIYGVLQALYCQQDGLWHLHNVIFDKNNSFKNFIDNNFKDYSKIKNIRSTRDDIAGHPSNRNYGEEFYFIAKSNNSKYEFEYGGYAFSKDKPQPEFKPHKVKLKNFIETQESFAVAVLNFTRNKIKETIKGIKGKLKLKLDNNFDYDFKWPMTDIRKAIFNDPMPNVIDDRLKCAGYGYDNLKNYLDKVKEALQDCFNEKIPASFEDIFRFTDHIMKKIENWINEDALHKNIEAEIFLESLEKHLGELKETLNDCVNKS